MFRLFRLLSLWKFVIGMKTVYKRTTQKDQEVAEASVPFLEKFNDLRIKFINN